MRAIGRIEVDLDLAGDGVGDEACLVRLSMQSIENVSGDVGRERDARTEGDLEEADSVHGALRMVFVGEDVQALALGVVQEAFGRRHGE